MKPTKEQIEQMRKRKYEKMYSGKPINKKGNGTIRQNKI